MGAERLAQAAFSVIPAWGPSCVSLMTVWGPGRDQRVQYRQTVSEDRAVREGKRLLKKLGKIKTIGQDREGVEAPPGQYVTEKFPVLTFGPTPIRLAASWPKVRRSKSSSTRMM